MLRLSTPGHNIDICVADLDANGCRTGLASCVPDLDCAIAGCRGKHVTLGWRPLEVFNGRGVAGKGARVGCEGGARVGGEINLAVVITGEELASREVR